jgi:SMC interacting uncharacterized protein involved in chromosome segregation
MYEKQLEIMRELLELEEKIKKGVNVTDEMKQKLLKLGEEFTKETEKFIENHKTDETIEFKEGIDIQKLKGNKLLDYVLEQQGKTLWMSDRQITDLAEFDLFKWYNVEHKGNEIHISEVEY